MVAISVDTPEQSKALQATFAEKEGLEIPLLCDPTHAAVKAFGVYDHPHKIALPSIVILDPRGAIAWRYSGSSVFDRPDEAGLIARVKQLAAELRQEWALPFLGAGNKGPFPHGWPVPTRPLAPRPFLLPFSGGMQSP